MPFFQCVPNYFVHLRLPTTFLAWRRETKAMAKSIAFSVK